MAKFEAAHAPAYRPDIDGLRAIAVGSVVLYHAGLPFLSGGFAGVDVFFVISGFLIGTIIFTGVRGGTFSFADFYARRARRILPALIAVIAATMALGALLLSAAEYKKAAQSALSALMAISNIHFEEVISYFNPDAATDPMLMTWSLGIEEQFYLLLPFVLIALKRFSDRTILLVLSALTLSSLALCLHLATTAPPQAFYLLPARAWELGVGVLLGVWMATGGKVLAGRAGEAASASALMVVLASFCLVSEDDIWPGLLTIPAVIATAALIATPHARINRLLLSSAPMVGIGLISYSWYLWHWPLFTYLRIAAVGEPTPGAMATAVLISLALGYASWRFIEQPFRKSRAPAQDIVRRYGAAMGAVALAVGSIIALHGMPQRVPPAAKLIDETVAAAHDGKCMSASGDLKIVHDCQNIDPARELIVLIGDSHAGALAPGVIDYARRQGKGWALFNMGDCRPMLEVAVVKQDDPGFSAKCAKFMRFALNQARSNAQVTDVILAGLWGGGSWNRNIRYLRQGEPDFADQKALLVEGLGNAVKYLKAGGKRVHVAQGTPYWEIDPAQAALSQAIPARKWLAGLVSQTDAATSEFAAVKPQYRYAERDIAEAVTAAGGRFFATNDGFCEKRGCRYRQGDSLLYVDRSHLSPAGAGLAMQGFERNIDAGLAASPTSSGPNLARQDF